MNLCAANGNNKKITEQQRPQIDPQMGGDGGHKLGLITLTDF
jgi:hypothetical protein